MSVSLVGSKAGVRRAVVVVTVIVAVLCMTGWALVGRTPAAQRVVEKIKPYDPLQ